MVYDLNTLDLTSCRYKYTLYFEILQDVKIITWCYFKTTGPILLKFTGYDERTHKAFVYQFSEKTKILQEHWNFKLQWAQMASMVLYLSKKTKSIELFTYFP